MQHHPLQMTHYISVCACFLIDRKELCMEVPSKNCCKCISLMVDQSRNEGVYQKTECVIPD